MTPLEIARTGLVVRGGIPPVTATDLLTRGIDVGLSPAFVTEVSGTAGTVVTAAVATRRPGSVLGTAIIPLGSRTDAALAMEATSIAALAGAPFHLGVGVSTPRIVEDWHRVPYRPTVDATRERLRQLRALLDGRPRGGWALDTTERPHVELLLGVLGPRMLELAYAETSGAIANLTPADAISAPPVGGSLYAAVWVKANPGVDDRCRRELASYALSPPYARHLARLGYGDVVEQVQHLHRAGRLREAPATLPDELIDALYVDTDGLAARLAAYRAAGAHPIVLPVTGPDPVTEVDQLLAIFTDRAGDDRSTTQQPHPRQHPNPLE